MEAILDKLFESTAKARLLKLFLMNPEREFVMQEIVKQTQLKKPAVQKELAKLIRLGLVKMKMTKVAKMTRGANVSKAAKVTKIARVAKMKKAAKEHNRKQGVTKEIKRKQVPAKAARVVRAIKVKKVAKKKGNQLKSKKR